MSDGLWLAEAQCGDVSLHVQRRPADDLLDVSIVDLGRLRNDAHVAIPRKELRRFARRLLAMTRPAAQRGGAQ